MEVLGWSLLTLPSAVHLDLTSKTAGTSAYRGLVSVLPSGMADDGFGVLCVVA